MEPERKFIGEALPGDLEELHTEVARMTYAMVQNTLLLRRRQWQPAFDSLYYTGAPESFGMPRDSS